MKKSFPLIIAVMLVSLTGCDFLRKIAGRPTSQEVDNMRVVMLQAEEAKLQKRIDSLRLAVDSLQAPVDEETVQQNPETLESLKAMGVRVSGSERFKGFGGGKLEYKYYIIVGIFGDQNNAKRLFNQASAKGYGPVLINCSGGMLAVGISPTNDSGAIVDSYLKIREEAFCPKDAWILVN